MSKFTIFRPGQPEASPAGRVARLFSYTEEPGLWNDVFAPGLLTFGRFLRGLFWVVVKVLVTLLFIAGMIWHGIFGHTVPGRGRDSF